MRVLQITAAYKPAYVYGGPTMSVAKLCEALAHNGVDIEVLTTTANGKQELCVPQGVKQIVDSVSVTYFKRLTKDHTHFSPNLLWALRTKIKAAKKLNLPVVVHIHAWWNLVSIMTCTLAKWYQIPVVLSPRGMLTNYTLGNRNSASKSIIHTIVGKKLLQYCHIHATSEKEKEDILQIINPKSITIIPNLVSFSPDVIIASPNVQPPFKLIFLSRIEEKKGLELLFTSLSNLNLDWSLTIAGTGEEKYIESLKLKAEQLKIQDKINWVGRVENKDKFKMLAQHHLMVLTSYNENFANVVIESLSVGTPVLLSDQVGLIDYVQQKELGWVTSLDAKTIHQKLETAYHQIKKQEEIREKAPIIIASDFDSTALVLKYIDLYAQVN